MLFHASILFLQLCSTVLALPTEQQPLKYISSDSVLTVRAELRKAEIIPTVVDDFIPSLTLSASWSKKHAADLGNTLKPKHLQDAPSLALHDETNPDGCATTNTSYVVVLTDPDAPSRDNPEWSEFCHWIASGIHLSQKTYSILPVPFVRAKETKKNDDIKEVMEWYPPGPPEKTGKHRYVFLVFAPANGTTQPLELSKPKERKHWGYGEERKGVREWAKENGLTPIAANFIYAQNKKQ